MATAQIITLDRLKTFKDKCDEKFAAKTEVDQNESDINEYVLEITDEWYESNLKFDTSALAGGAAMIRFEGYNCTPDKTALALFEGDTFEVLFAANEGYHFGTSISYISIETDSAGNMITTSTVPARYSFVDFTLVKVSGAIAEKHSGRFWRVCITALADE